jgi:hypothetical protein
MTLSSKHMGLQFNTGLKYNASTALVTFRSFVLGGMENVSTDSGLSQTQNPWHLIFRPLTL